MSDVTSGNSSESHDELQFRSTLNALTQSIKRYLVVQPKPDALSTAKAVLLPTLYALHQDIWHPLMLAHNILPNNEHVRYKVVLDGDSMVVTVDVWAVGTSLERFPARDTLPEGSIWGVRTNGSDWQLVDFTNKSEINSCSIFDENFPFFVKALFNHGDDSLETRLKNVAQVIAKSEIMAKLEQIIALQGIDSVRENSGGTAQGVIDLLQAEQLISDELVAKVSVDELEEIITYNLRATTVGIDANLAEITFNEISRHCQIVKNLKGNLNATFDGEELEVSSRSGLYYILAALAVRHGRTDAILVEDLTRPPDPKPDDSSRSRPLGKPGWYLSLGNSQNFNQGVRQLLQALNLEERLKATNRGQPFPPED